MNIRKLSIILLLISIKPCALLAASMAPCSGNYSETWDSCHGTVSFDNGSVYTGEFSKGRINGKGVYEYAATSSTSAGRYSGEFVNGARHGYGTYTYDAGGIYVGAHRNNNFEGNGKITYPNGDSYEGEFFEGLPNGKGEGQFASGVRWKGTWYAGNPQGPGITTLSDGSTRDAILDFSTGELKLLDANGNTLEEIEVFSTTSAHKVQSLALVDLNNGLGTKARDELIHILSVTPEKKSFEIAVSLTNVLVTCMLLGDTSCFAEQYDAYQEEFFKVLEDAPKSTNEEREIHDQNLDQGIALLTYRSLIGLDEETLKTTTSWSEHVYPGSPTGAYAAMRAALNARAALLAGNRVAAEDSQRRARFFLTHNSLRQVANQIALIFTLENDLYFFNDAEAVRRFLTHCSDGTLGDIKNNLIKICANSDFLNPYVYARLLNIFIESGALNGTLETKAVESLHHLYNQIEIVEGSIVDQNRESLYTYLAIRETFGDQINLTFNPREIINTLELDSPDGIGGFAYLQIIEAIELSEHSENKPLDSAKARLDDLINELDVTVGRLGKRSKTVLTPSLHLLKSIMKRADKDDKGELQELQSFIDTRIDYLRTSNISVLNKTPEASKTDHLISRYVIDRLNKIAPQNRHLIDYALFISASIASAEDGNIQRAYNLLSVSDGAMDEEHIRTRIALEERYYRYLGTRYAISSLGRNGNNEIFEGAKYTDAHYLSGDMYQNMYEKTRQFTAKFRDIENPIFNITADYLRDINDQDETLFLFSDAGDFGLSIQFSDEHWRVWIIDNSSIKSIRNEIALLSSQELRDHEVSEIIDASRRVSEVIFQEKITQKNKLTFLNGPTILGIPYTLLRDPWEDDWLIKKTIPRAFKSPIHKKLSRIESSEPENLSYVAFANPNLRSEEETQKISAIEMMIRGVTADTSSLEELPETEEEVKNFGSQFDGETKYFFGPHANIDNLFAQNLNEIEVLSFNTHGVLAGELEGNMSSAVVLSKTKKNNGLIPETWLFSLYGAPRVTMLMTCNSGSQSENLKGLEIKSLADVFLMKGTDAVVSSYWQVNSIATSALTNFLGRETSRGLSWSEAMTKGTRHLMEETSWTHPADWAAFIITGDYTSRKNIKTSGNSTVSRTFEGSSNPAPMITPLGTLFGVINTERTTHYSLLQTREKHHFVEDNIGQYDAVTIYSSNIEKNSYIAYFNTKYIEFHMLDDRKEQHPLVCSYTPNNSFSATNLPYDFVVNGSTIFLISYATEETDNYASINITSLESSTCRVIFSRKFSVNLNGSTEFRIFPSVQPNHVILTHTTATKRTFSLDRDQRRSDHGFGMSCTENNQGQHHLLDMNLTSKNTIANRNMRFLASPNAIQHGVNVILSDPCVWTTITRIVKNKWFEEEYLIMDHLGYDKRYEEISDFEVFLSSSFNNVVRYWHFSDYLGDLIYVHAFVGYTFDDDEIFGPSGATVKTRDKRQIMNSGIFVYDVKSGGDWQKLSGSNECDPTSFPLTFQGNPSYACNLNQKDWQKPKRLEIRQAITH
jgi:CHAT domain-containing protein